ncbi:DnaA N-terminal domain-containing protein [Ruegeria halocynthiae]|uniref:DnaA N-terminal domain-containing protein n=1 Tax=Ruegeria halocynthiae TaxID=985054 RepID=A0A1H3E811_9RHOB|nr:DnaA N-terminal domain-containing protein [Ruegeria halocynthiae]SDX74883.1 DnaA N-terminal domain-containing protein [Ruegeria halocynthiae]
MQVAKPVGRNAPALKYDILSALAVHALSGDKHRQRSVLRITALITTRYNWRSNELSIGREEIARLWSVNERTVKREMAKLRSAGWIAVKRPAARGRVAVYEIDLKQILLDTVDVWRVIGTDFQERMQQEPAEDNNVVPFQPKPAIPPPQGEDVWAQVQEILHNRDPELWSSWFRHLNEAERAGGQVTLIAPSRFMADYIAQKWPARVLAAYARIDPSIRALRIEAAD